MLKLLDKFVMIMSEKANAIFFFYFDLRMNEHSSHDLIGQKLCENSSLDTFIII